MQIRREKQPNLEAQTSQDKLMVCPRIINGLEISDSCEALKFINIILEIANSNFKDQNQKITIQEILDYSSTQSQSKIKILLQSSLNNSIKLDRLIEMLNSLKKLIFKFDEENDLIMTNFLNGQYIEAFIKNLMKCIINIQDINENVEEFFLYFTHYLIEMRKVHTMDKSVFNFFIDQVELYIQLILHSSSNRLIQGIYYLSIELISLKILPIQQALNILNNGLKVFHEQDEETNFYLVRVLRCTFDCSNQQEFQYFVSMALKILSLLIKQGLDENAKSIKDICYVIHEYIKVADIQELYNINFLQSHLLLLVEMDDKEVIKYAVSVLNKLIRQPQKLIEDCQVLLNGFEKTSNMLFERLFELIQNHSIRLEYQYRIQIIEIFLFFQKNIQVNQDIKLSYIEVLMGLSMEEKDPQVLFNMYLTINTIIENLPSYIRFDNKQMLINEMIFETDDQILLQESLRFYFKVFQLTQLSNKLIFIRYMKSLKVEYVLNKVLIKTEQKSYRQCFEQFLNELENEEMYTDQ